MQIHELTLGSDELDLRSSPAHGFLLGHLLLPNEDHRGPQSCSSSVSLAHLSFMQPASSLMLLAFRSGTWTGLGGTTFAATDSKNSGSRFGFKSKGQTDTFDSNFDITSTNTLGYSSGGAYGPGGVNRPSPLLLGRREPGTVGINRGGNGGFTNRLTLGEIDATEQWEMDVKSPGDSPASDMYPEAGPSTASSSGSMNKRGLSTADLGDIGNGGEERMFNESTSEVNVDEFKEGESFHPLGRAL